MVHQQLLNYYTQLVKECGGIPPRSAVKPTDIKPILAWVILGERHSSEETVLTVIGSAIDEALAVSLTGENLFDYYSVETLEQLRPFYTKMYAHPCGGFTVRNITNKYGNVEGLEVLLLPLKDDSGSVNRLIGSIAIHKRTLIDHGFGKPKDFGDMTVIDMEYRDIGYGVPG